MRRDADRLADIVEAAAKIEERVQRGRERFDVDEDMRLAVTRLIE